VHAGIYYNYPVNGEVIALINTTNGENSTANWDALVRKAPSFCQLSFSSS
jgi:hypothetical protein